VISHRERGISLSADFLALEEIDPSTINKKLLSDFHKRELNFRLAFFGFPHKPHEDLIAQQASAPGDSYSPLIHIFKQSEAQ
jgi:hypothetical protein